MKMDRATTAYHQDYFQRIRRRTFAIQAMAPLALLTVALMDSSLTSTPLWTPARAAGLLGGVAAMALLILAMARTRTIAVHGWLTIAMLCVAELSIALIVTPNPRAAWAAMPVLMVIPVAAAPFWIRRARAIACCLSCYACAYLLLHRSGADTVSTGVFLVLAALFTCTSLAVFRSIDRLRRNAYEFQRDLDMEASRDALTGLLSRRRFLEAGEVLADAQASRGKGFAMCFLDLDRFKHLNDLHGHDAGDRALARVAGILLSHAPKKALVARMGGEEFVMMLPGFDARTARDLVESIRLAIAAEQVESTHLSASAGVSVNRPGETLKQVLHRADGALLLAKQRGRNRVEDAEAADPA